MTTSKTSKIWVAQKTPQGIKITVAKRLPRKLKKFVKEILDITGDKYVATSLGYYNQVEKLLQALKKAQENKIVTSEKEKE